ncbi:MAG: site-specific DNA-methyltransferase [Bifidobacteriaceae bacterium]|jgi:site-specific DNA-methyltransferase (adenine-specific)|nr:site-specific DNA-methyltransferase [Bifidobacteriaceae bacterium]
MHKDLLNTIIVGNCIGELRKMPSESIDLIFADPPYYMQTEGELLRTDGSKFAGVEDEWDKFNGYAEYDEFCEAWLTECKRVLKKDGSIWVIGAFQNIYRIGYIMQNLGYWIINDVVWSKPNAVPNFMGTRFQNSHETMLWCTKSKSAKYAFNYKTMKHLNGDKQDKSVWNIGIAIGNERLKDENGKKVHSTQKPEKLLYKVIASSSRLGDIVLDPFFGTGTTGAMAKMLGRNFIGIEKSEKYTKVARARIDKVKFVDDEIANGTLDVKPPKVSLTELIKKELLFENEPLYDKHGNNSFKLLNGDKVTDGYDSLSIHKMSAKYLNRANYNGWTYFYVKRDGELVPIDSLRYVAKEMENAK